MPMNPNSIIPPLAHTVCFVALLTTLTVAYPVGIYYIRPEIELWKVGFAALAIVSISAIAGLPDRADRLLVHIVIATLIVPSLALMAWAGLPLSYGAICVGALLIAIATSRMLSNSSWYQPLVRSNHAFFVIIIFIAAYMAAQIYFAGKYISFDLFRVYELRREIAANVPSWMEYARAIVSHSLIPLATVLALYANSWSKVVITIVAGILMFALTAHKAPAFYPFFSIGVWFLSSRRRPVVALCSLLLIIVALSLIDRMFFLHGMKVLDREPRWLSAVFLERALMAPSVLNWFYQRYFLETESYYWWSYSRITLGLIASPFELLPANLIGREAFNNAQMAANSGFIGMGLANAGILGVIAHSVALGGFLIVARMAHGGNGITFATAALSMPIYTFATASDLVTTLTTHGALITIVAVLGISDSKNATFVRKKTNQGQAGDEHGSPYGGDVACFQGDNHREKKRSRQ